MKPKERRSNILSILHALQREWHVKELADKLQVSELTIRRDLSEMEKHGDIIRTHGGCIASGNGSFSTIFYKEFERNIKLKRAIGKEAIGIVKGGDTILLGDGSTAYQFAANLKDCGPVTIYTNNIAAIQELKKCQDIKLYVLGGEYDYQFNMLSLKGSMSDRILETLHFNLIVIGTDGISVDGQCLSKNEEIARTNQIILRRGERKILLADHTKIGASANVIYGEIGDFDLWVTSCGLDKGQMQLFKNRTKIKEVVEDDTPFYGLA